MTTNSIGLPIPVPVSKGGTGAITAAAALTNLGAFSQIVYQGFTSSGTYTPSANMKFCIIECVGGGGGGGSVYNSIAGNQSGGGGGGGGSWSLIIATSATIGVSKSVTIGAGGSGGAAGAANTGVTGGNTSVGTICIAIGGVGGLGITGTSRGTGGAGGLGSSGTGAVLFSGGKGFDCMFGNTSPVILVGAGGSSHFSPNSQVVGNNANSNGAAGIAYGQGGNGGFAYNTASGSLAGGAGSSGYILITEYI